MHIHSPTVQPHIQPAVMNDTWIRNGHDIIILRAAQRCSAERAARPAMLCISSIDT